MKFSILIPTKNRINNIKNVVKTIYEKANDKENIEVIFYVDIDDNDSKNCIDSLNNKNVKWASSEHKILFSDMWNHAYKKSTGQYLMLCGDDVEFQTQDWDDKILDAFDKIEDKIAYVCPDDGHQSGRLGVHGFVSKKWIELIGFFTPPYFSYWYADTWLDEVSRMINRFIYVQEVKIIHCHWQTNNSKGVDSVYYENHKKLNEQLHQLYRTKSQERIDNAKILKDYINDFKK